MPILDMPTTCTLSSHRWPRALLSGGAARAPDHNCQGVVSQSTRGSVIYFVVATLAEVNRFPSSTSIRWASEIGATSVYCYLNLVHVSCNDICK